MVDVIADNGCVLTLSYAIEADIEPIEAEVITTDATSMSGGTAEIQIINEVLVTAILWDNGTEGAVATELSVGQHFVTVTDVYGCTYTFDFVIEMSTSVANLDKAALNVYPTVTSSSLTLTTTGESLDVETVAIVDVSGVRHQTLPTPQGHRTMHTYEVSELPSGAYYLVVLQEGILTSFPFVKM